MPHSTYTLDSGGPVVTAGVSISEARREALGDGAVIPQPRVIRALLDTGAAFTTIDPATMTALGLTPTGTIDILTPSTGTNHHTTDTYDVDLQIGTLRVPNLRVAACELGSGLNALIGRDVLSRCILIYNGTARIFSLAY